MQKLLLTAITTLMLLAPLAAAAESYSGSILLGHPGTGIVGGVTEIVEPCTPGGATSGFDGVWFDIGNAGGLPFTLEMDATLDADVWFYDADCAFISDSVGAKLPVGAVESGAVPAGAFFAIVDGYVGSGAFVLNVG